MLATPATLDASTNTTARWAAVLARDSTAAFVYGVKTTGIYARPGDHAKLPKPANIEFFDTAAQAEAAGYRPSAQGSDTTHSRHHQAITQACQILEDAPARLALSDLAHQVHMSPHHFHRVFKKTTGLTPNAYGLAVQAQKVRASLSAQCSVTVAQHDAGFSTSSRFYETAVPLLGMKPSVYRSGGVHEVIRFAVGQCSLGAILVAQSDKGICAILMGEDPQTLVNDLQDRFTQATLVGGEAEFEATVAQVVGFIEAPQTGLALPLDIRGTAFQHRVWLALQQVPAGATVSYVDLAHRIGAPKASRAIAGACAANPLAVAIPCHRVIRQDGQLSGYRWGVERKRALLEREVNADA